MCAPRAPERVAKSSSLLWGPEMRFGVSCGQLDSDVVPNGVALRPLMMVRRPLRRAQRLVDDPDGAVWYGARRIFAYALIIYDGMPLDRVHDYLRARAWLTDAARLLSTEPESLAIELVKSMLHS